MPSFPRVVKLRSSVHCPLTRDFCPPSSLARRLACHAVVWRRQVTS